MDESGSSRRVVLITGVSGGLGQRLLTQLSEFDVVGVDVREPRQAPARFAAIDLGLESSCQNLLHLMREVQPFAVIHSAFVDPIGAGEPDLDRIWRINVAGTARLMEAVSIVNRQSRDGAVVHKVVFLSSVSAYGPDLTGFVKEDCPLSAHSFAYAVHKREADQVVQERAAMLDECSTYILRPSVLAGPTVENWMLSALRGIPAGAGKRAQRWREHGKKLPVILPRGEKYLANRLQFVHVDDVARLIAHILQRTGPDGCLNVLNVAGAGEPLTIEQAAEMAGNNILQVPSRALCRLILWLAWKLGVSALPPDAFAYLAGSVAMDTSRLREFLGSDYEAVMGYSSAAALRETFAARPVLSQKESKPAVTR